MGDVTRYVQDDDYHVMVPVESEVGARLLRDGAVPYVLATDYETLREKLAAVVGALEWILSNAGGYASHSTEIMVMDAIRRRADAALAQAKEV